MSEIVYRSNVSNLWHFARRDGRSACVGGKLSDSKRDAADVPRMLRCTSNGCRVRWRAFDEWQPLNGLHELHVTGWSFGTTDLKLYCHSWEDSPCFADIDEHGVEIGRRASCNLVEWFENVGDEMIEETLNGPPPWRVYADWSNGDYPVLVSRPLD